MSFQTSHDDTTFGPSGEKIFPSSTKGQIFIFENKIYSLYSELINNQYSIIVYNITDDQNKTIYTSDKNPVIRTLQVDTATGNIWFGGYLDKPMVGFFAMFRISRMIDSISSLSIRESIKTIETICIVNINNIIYSGITKKNECVIMNNSSTNIYKINTTLNNFSVKEIYLRNRIYHVFIEGISSSTNKSKIEMYKINNNTLLGSF
jgi:hypothetical protein